MTTGSATTLTGLLFSQGKDTGIYCWNDLIEPVHINSKL
jgi:DUF971 family protein